VGEGVKSCLDFLVLTDDQKELLMHYMREIIADKERIADISGVKLKQIENSVFKLSIAKVLQGDELFILCVLYDITQEASLMKYFENLSIVDALTGIYNRRYLEEKLEEYMNLAKRHDRPLSLIMFDIDFFKHINDSFGHDVGDKVLKAIAKAVSENIRNTDIFARYGGEEFVIIAPETTKEDAKTLAEKLRVSMENLYLEEGVSPTCSFGVVSLEKPDTKETLLKRVDDALYEAKKTGRNKVVVA
jgi:diguanylate cyclase (GGDEF)-like protein